MSNPALELWHVGMNGAGPKRGFILPLAPLWDEAEDSTTPSSGIAKPAPRTPGPIEEC